MYRQNWQAELVRVVQIREMIRKQVVLGNLKAAKDLADQHNVSNLERLDLGVEFSTNPKHQKIPQAMGCTL